MSDGGEVSGLSDVSWVDSASEGHKFHLFMIIQHYYLSLNLENLCILTVGKFYTLALLGIKQILVVLALIVLKSDAYDDKVFATS